MNFDRNTIIGFIALAILFLGYFFYTTQEQQAYQQAKAKNDSIANLNKPVPNPVVVARDSMAADSLARVSAAGDFGDAIRGEEKLVTIENDLLKISFSNKGGQPRSVELKHFKAPDSTNVKLAATDFDKIVYTVNTGANKAAEINNFYFADPQITRGADGSQVISYQLQSPNNTSITHQFVIKPGQYLIEFNLQLNGVPQLLSGNTLNLTWQNKALQLQKDLAYEKMQSQVSYRVDGDFDYSSAAEGGSESFNDPVNWIGIKQQFFNTTLIAKNGFTSGNINWTTPAGGSTVVQATANLKMDLPAATSATVPLAVYYGPTDYKILKQYGND